MVILGVKKPIGIKKWVLNLAFQFPKKCDRKKNFRNPVPKPAKTQLYENITENSSEKI